MLYFNNFSYRCHNFGLFTCRFNRKMAELMCISTKRQLGFIIYIRNSVLFPTLTNIGWKTNIDAKAQITIPISNFCSPLSWQRALNTTVKINRLKPEIDFCLVKVIEKKIYIVLFCESALDNRNYNSHEKSKELRLATLQEKSHSEDHFLQRKLKFIRFFLENFSRKTIRLFLL